MNAKEVMVMIGGPATEERKVKARHPMVSKCGCCHRRRLGAD